MQARYYDPVIGRFYSNDPIGFRDVHSFNRYAYANNNPFRFTDPTGMSPEVDIEIPDVGEVVANMLGLDGVDEGNRVVNNGIDSVNDGIETTGRELVSRTTVSVDGTAGVGLGVKAGVTVDSGTFNGEGVELSGALTGTAYGTRASGTVNFVLVKPDASASGPIGSTTVMGGAGLGGGVTIQWTPSIGVTVHAGIAAGASVSSKVAGDKTRVFESE
ncbi:RHS repeat-associated core domain-containing protein [Idiomarina sp. M1R2S28]|uniref:RHS repeat-associated core domain-containing protein n=1 Tax=Idiomarina rhizosphaerae TaxID=2961572 RepID=A0A9X2FV31_9GAMM|nr:RHS repeat-associated core domain-containing protein [Idiomarina rhizosphaerae]MCP1338170.1 RHS repeat-associated core domain-containing protein [Idiomarina rhizosphaerae]